MSQGTLLILSGPSGAGKSTVIQRILERHPDFFFSVSATTRQPRGSENLHSFRLPFPYSLPFRLTLCFFLLLTMLPDSLIFPHQVLPTDSVFLTGQQLQT